MNPRPIIRRPRGLFSAGLCFLAACVAAAAAAPRRVVVDPGTPGAFSTLAAAVPALKAGDTLWLAPGSGPYREVLYVTASGTADAPITIEGNGNEITGFDVLNFERLPDGRHAADLRQPHPFVLRHEGRRVMESAPAGRFPEGVEHDRATGRLVLAAGLSPAGWEVSARSFAVRVANVSHHRYRNLVASGSKNDGFSLHGEGVGLVFENIVGRQNLDEGFSAHGTIECSVLGGEFYENDNGMLSGQRTLTRLERVDFRNNLGLGFGFNGEARVEGARVRAWGNGMMQLLLREGVSVRWSGVEIYRNIYASRPLVTHMESARWQTPKTIDVPASFPWLGEPAKVLDAISPGERIAADGPR